MSFHHRRIFAIPALAAAAFLSFAAAARAQEAPVVSRDSLQTDAVPEAHPDGHAVDGNRHGQAAETFAVVPGTRFLVSLESDLNTKQVRKNQEFHVRTLEPLFAGQGNFLPAGAVIVGHVSRVDPAGSTGRAKIWLTFDEIHTHFGRLPIVAEVAGRPGDHSILPGPSHGGAMETPRRTPTDTAQT